MRYGSNTENRNRRVKALQLAKGLGNNPKEALATLKLVEAAYRASQGHYGPSWKAVACRWSVAASIALVSIGTFETFEHGIAKVEASHGPPIIVGSARFVSDVVQEGEQLEIVASHKYLRVCDWSVVRNWYQGHSKIAVTTINLPAIAISADFQSGHWPIELPNGLKPGAYRMQATLKGNCGTDDLYSGNVFEQNFTLVPRS